jgi:23S rRNA pseudouridine2605 synthase
VSARGEGERLQKVLARVGYGSRRVCDELIASGRVKVNGQVAVLGQRVDPAFDKVSVDGTTVGVLPDLVHYLLNKPSGVITSADDPGGRRKVTDLVPSEPRVFPVGRLDFATEGLIILTNDGDLAQRLAHPSHGVEKEYLAEVSPPPNRGAIAALRRGVVLEDGTLTAPAGASLLAPNLVRITIHEGRYRQVRRMLDAVGHPVKRLVRTRIGPLTDTRLAPGEWRRLTTAEVRALSEASASRSLRSEQHQGQRGVRRDR